MLARDEAEQPAAVRELRLQTYTGQAGRLSVTVRQRAHGRRYDGGAGARDDIRSRDRVTGAVGLIVLFPLEIIIILRCFFFRLEIVKGLYFLLFSFISFCRKIFNKLY